MSEPLPAHANRTSPHAAAWLGGVCATLVAAPLLLVGAFSAHEPSCALAENFWNGDRPHGDGPVRGVLLGSSRMGTDVDVHALADATGFAWQRVARHSVQQSSIAASYPRMLGLTEAEPGLDVLVIEVSSLLYDATGCGRPELANLPLQPQWWGTVRQALGPEAPLLPSLAMEFLPHRWPMTSGRRSDILAHARDPVHALGLISDAPTALSGLQAPARWQGEPAPDLTAERAQARRAFLLGGPLDTFVPEPSTQCLATLESLLRAAAPRRTVLVELPMRASFRDAVPVALRNALRGELEALAGRVPGVENWDATDRFATAEDAHFLDFDHLGPDGAAAFTRDLVDRIAAGAAEVP